MKTKMFLIGFACLMLNVQNIFSQKECDKKIKVHKDEYTDEETTSSEEVKIISKYGGSLLKAVLDTYGGDSGDRYLSMYFHEEQNRYWLAFKHYFYGGSSSRELADAYIKFIDDSVTKLENPISNPQMEDGSDNSYTITFFEISEGDLKNLCEKDIKKIRASLVLESREPILETELDNKKSKVIKNLATCFVAKAPKLSPPEQIAEEEGESDNPRIQNNREGKIDSVKTSKIDSIKALGNNNIISIHKQWKLVTQLNKNGIPMNQLSAIIQFFEDGTYKSLTSLNGQVIEAKGKFSMISDNKILVFTRENGTTYSYAIKKLSNSELEIQSEDFTSIYIVY